MRDGSSSAIAIHFIDFSGGNEASKNIDRKSL